MRPNWNRHQSSRTSWSIIRMEAGTQFGVFQEFVYDSTVFFHKRISCFFLLCSRKQWADSEATNPHYLRVDRKLQKYRFLESVGFCKAERGWSLYPITTEPTAMTLTHQASGTLAGREGLTEVTIMSVVFVDVLSDCLPDVEDSRCFFHLLASPANGKSIAASASLISGGFDRERMAENRQKSYTWRHPPPHNGCPSPLMGESPMGENLRQVATGTMPSNRHCKANSAMGDFCRGAQGGLLGKSNNHRQCLGLAVSAISSRMSPIFSRVSIYPKVRERPHYLIESGSFRAWAHCA